MTSFVKHQEILSWGRVVRRPQTIAAPKFIGELERLVRGADEKSLLAVGLMRSYGDSVFNTDGRLVHTVGLDRFISFDRENGVLRAEAGVSLNDALAVTVPSGWFVPVVPGSRFVTLAGAVANDVHGKNHHIAGTFGRHVQRLGLQRSDGELLTIGPNEQPELFAATVGGLGLTGVIAWVEIKLQRIGSAFLDVEVLPFERLDAFWALADESEKTHEHTVAWIDCTRAGPDLGRGIFTRANWSRDGRFDVHRPQPKLRLPVDAPSMLLNRFTVSLFNKLYYANGRRNAGTHQQHYSQVFHPLDGIAHWNRLYGRPGFWQYQCVLPRATMREATRTLLQEIVRSKQGSFLAVLKTFGVQKSPGLLSFPMEGATLALDFPNKGSATSDLLGRLDDIVSEAKGRLYAAKDGRVPEQMWAQGYPNLGEFRRWLDPAFSSDFWKRVSK